MKTLFLFTLTVVLSLSLSARENPFAATNAYEEEAARIIELNEVDESAYGEEQFVQQMQEEMSVTKEFEKTNANKNKVEDAVNKLMPALKETKKANEKKFSEKEVKKLIKKAQAQTEAKTKKLIKKELENTKVVEPKQVVFVKPRPDVEMMEEEVMEEEMKMSQILPFLKLEYNNNEISIHTKYKVSKKFSLEKGNKIIIDYKAKLNFYTKRENLESMNYKKVAVGNHKKNGFFRVVVELDKAPKNYKVNYKNNLISIVKLNKM